MIRSMTAFARLEEEHPWGSLVWELRSVNHRYLDVIVRMPEELRQLEQAVRQRLAAGLARGKVECNLRYQAASAGTGALELDMDLVRELTRLSREVDEQVFNPAPLSSLDVMRWPGVVRTPKADWEELSAAVLGLFDRTLAELVDTRTREGATIADFLTRRLDDMAPQVAAVREALPQVLEDNRRRLRERLEELSGEVDGERLEQELVLFANRIDVAEELDRLDAHRAEVRRVLERDEPVGRRLDFLMQELNREANTLSSKSAATATTQAAVELKVLIEQMREQVQNIE